MAAATAAAARIRQALGIPHGPASAGDIEVVNTVDDLNHHIAQARGIPDAHVLLDRLVAVQGHVHLIVTLAEGIPCIVASLVENNVGHRIELLLGLVQVLEAHRHALRAVGAVEQHGDVNFVLAEPHVLIEAVRPDDLALARQLQAGVARSRRSRRRRTASTFNDGDVVHVQDELVVAVEVADGHIAHAAV